MGLDTAARTYRLAFGTEMGMLGIFQQRPSQGWGSEAEVQDPVYATNAFYDALETNDSAVAVLGDDTLKLISRELVESVRRNVTIDWTSRESVRAKLRLAVKRVLRKGQRVPIRIDYYQGGGGRSLRQFRVLLQKLAQQNILQELSSTR